MEKIMNKLTAYLWLGLAVIGLIGVIFYGAWWHLGTIAICWFFYKEMKDEE